MTNAISDEEIRAKERGLTLPLFGTPENPKPHPTNDWYIEDVLRPLCEWYAAKAVDAERERLLNLRPLSEYHEDYGPAMWYTLPIEEPPTFIGRPGDSDWSAYGNEYTHWQPLHMPLNHDEMVAEQTPKEPQ